MSNASPYTIDNLEPMTYVLKVVAEGYEPAIRAVRVAEGENRIETVILDRRRGSASLAVKSAEEKLSIWVDGTDTGQVTPATVLGLLAGNHLVTLRDRVGAIIHAGRVSLKEGSKESVEFP